MESTIAVTYFSLSASVGRFAGFGGGGTAFGNADPAWTTTQAAAVLDSVQSGVKNFYFPSPPCDWSFLHLYAPLELQAGQNTVQLPDDFGGIEGSVLITSQNGLPRVPLMNPEYVAVQQAQFPTTTGFPRIAALSGINGTTLVSGQRQSLIVFPAADQDYKLRVQYYVTPNLPTATSPYIYGGAQHAETILESCLAVFEQRYDDLNGLHPQLFLQRLQTSMAIDRRNKGQFTGRNYDTSDEQDSPDRYQDQFPSHATYNGLPVN